MSPPPAKQFSGIFVSYRRDDSSGHAGRVSDKLVEHFGQDRIFMDVDTIEPGEDFVSVIENAVGSCEILIAIIGRNWLTGTGGTTGRLDNPNDFVRLEIATALNRNIRVIPVLVQRATMPKAQDLPDDLAKFARRNAVELNDLRWHDDVDQLISVMERVLAKREEANRLAEAAKQTEEESRRLEQEEKRRVDEETQSRLVEEQEKKLFDEQRRLEGAESARRQAEEQAKREAQEDSAFRAEANTGAGLEKLGEPSAAVPAGDASTPAHRNKRVVLIAVASLIVLLVAAGLIWRWQGGRSSIDNANQIAAAQPSQVTQPSTKNPSETPAPTTPGRKPGEGVKNQMGIEFVYVPAGSFMMGSESGKVGKPVHRVTFSAGFYMGKYEVTQGQWHAVMGNNPSYFSACSNCPVEQVSWNDSQDFIAKLNEANDGFKYRLPSEADWEYACRAGTKGDYYAANVDDIGWFSDNSGKKTHAVGGKQPNAFGLYDMSGNVSEWCRDRYDPNYVGAPSDGSARLSEYKDQVMVTRGGSWAYGAAYLRSAFSIGAAPDQRSSDIGFRVVAVARTP